MVCNTHILKVNINTMIKITGKRTHKTAINKKVKAIADALGITCDVNVYFMDHTSPDKYGFAAEIMGSQYVCIFKDCPEDKLGDVISHEMVHILQTLRGDLKHDYMNRTFYWKGEKWDNERCESVNYYDRPWEAEAKKLEKKLAENFFMSN